MSPHLMRDIAFTACTLHCLLMSGLPRVAIQAR